MCITMRAYLSELLFLYMLGTTLGGTLTFDCFKDRCERNLTLVSIETRLNATIEEEKILQATIQGLLLARDLSTNGSLILINKNKQLLENVKKTELKLVVTETALNETKNNFTALEVEYKKLEDGKQYMTTIIITAVGSSLATLLVVALVLICKERCCTFSRKHKELHLSSEENRDETHVPMLDITKDTSDNTSDTSHDSGVSGSNSSTDDVTIDCAEPDESVAERVSEGEEGGGDNCRIKHTPDSLKNIQPTRYQQRSTL